MTARIVLYHGGCDDGFGAAWAARHILGDSATYIAANYGEALPDIPDGAEVWMLDFSYPRDVLAALAGRLHSTGGMVAVLDHHKSAAEDLAGLSFARFDMDKSGARLAWEDFMSPHDLPPLLAYVEDRDLWRFALPGTKEITAYVRSFPREFTTWDALEKMVRLSTTGVRNEGAAILRATAQHVEAHVRHAALVRLGPDMVPCVNATMLQSEIGAALCAKFPEAPFSLSYFDLAGGVRVWSLRSARQEIDCSVIAKRYGGGGHRGAAGFQTCPADFGPVSAP